MNDEKDILGALGTSGLDDIGVEERGADSGLDWTNDERTPLPDPEGVVRVFGWRILVMPLRPAMVSEGGILIPQVRQELDEYLTYVGRIVALGPLAYKHQKYAEMGLTQADIPKRGEWWLYPLNSYQRMKWKDTRLIVMNDETLLGRIPTEKGANPWDFKLER
jgi:hypothetical protein